MRTSIPEKLQKIVDDIDADGSAKLTRLTVLKKWFEKPHRLTAFGVWIAKQAAAKKGKTTGKAGLLFDASTRLLRKLGRGPMLRAPFARGFPVDRGSVQALHDRLRAFQNEYQKQAWGPVRIIKNWNLALIEWGLDLLLRPSQPTEGYQLAARFCRHYDSRHSDALCGPSRDRIMDLARFMATVEALEDE